MITYIIVFICIIFGSRITTSNHNNLVNNNTFRKKYCIFFAIVFILLLFLKHDYVGSDTQNYRLSYNFIKDFNDLPSELNLHTEVGYWLFQIFCHKLGLSFRFMMLLFAILYVSSILLLIYRYSAAPHISLLIFLFGGHFIFFSTSRQAVALSLSIYSFIVWNSSIKFKFKYIISIILVLIAILFHTSAIVFPLYFLLSKIPPKKSVGLISLVLFVIIMLFRKTIVPYLLGIVSENDYELIQTSGFVMILEYIMLCIVGVLYFNDLFDDDIEFWNQYKMFFIVLILLPIGKYNPFFFRIVKYFSIYEIIIIPKMIKKLKRDKLIQVLISICFVSYFGYSFFFSGSGIRNIPYVFFWDEYPPEKIPFGLYPAGGW